MTRTKCILSFVLVVAIVIQNAAITFISEAIIESDRMSI